MKEKIAVYGAGQMGMAALELLRNRGQCVQMILDKNDRLDAADGDGPPVLNPEMTDVAERPLILVLVCVAVCHFNEIEEELKLQGYSRIIPCGDYIRLLYPEWEITNLWTFQRDDEEAERSWKKQIDRNLELFSDECSREYYQKAAWFFENGRDHADFRAYLPKEKYFPPEIRAVLGHQEIIADTFSLNGDYIRQAEKFGIGFERYYLFAASEKEIVNYKDQSAVVTSQAELSSESGKRNLTRLGIMRPYTSEKAREIFFDTLDHQMEHHPYTYLRCYSMSPCLDILSGGIGTIQDFRPVLAVNIGHYQEDFLQIPVYLGQRLENYRWLYRQHGYYGNDSILYGIPEERYSGKRKI